MSSIIPLEEIDRRLAYPTLKVTKGSHGPDNAFQRLRYVTAARSDKTVAFTIEWWSNLAYLHTEDGLIIPFHSLSLSNTWPHNSKMDLRLTVRNDTVGILSIDN